MRRLILLLAGLAILVSADIYYPIVRTQWLRDIVAPDTSDIYPKFLRISHAGRPTVLAGIFTVGAATDTGLMLISGSGNETLLITGHSKLGGSSNAFQWDSLRDTLYTLNCDTIHGKVLIYSNGKIEIRNAGNQSVKLDSTGIVWRHLYDDGNGGMDTYPQFIGTYSIQLGWANVASGEKSVVMGGDGNQATAAFSTAGGGLQNSATGTFSTSVGGSLNVASGNASMACGGWSNYATSTFSSANGGRGNVASESCATANGGQWDSASGKFSTTLGGERNKATGRHSVAAGFGARAGNNQFVYRDTVNLGASVFITDSVRALYGFVGNGAGLTGITGTDQKARDSANAAYALAKADSALNDSTKNARSAQTLANSAQKVNIPTDTLVADSGAFRKVTGNGGGLTFVNAATLSGATLGNIKTYSGDSARTAAHDTAIVYTTIPGTVISWWGDSAAAFPAGYVLCNGTLKYKDIAGDSIVTPNLSGRYLVFGNADSSGWATYRGVTRGGDTSYTPAGTNTGGAVTAHTVTPTIRGTAAGNVTTSGNHAVTDPTFGGTKATIVPSYFALWPLIRSRTW
jgi:hypothetical protein